jgi:hypothetical protein
MASHLLGRGIRILRLGTYISVYPSPYSFSVKLLPLSGVDLSLLWRNGGRSGVEDEYGRRIREEMSAASPFAVFFSSSSLLVASSRRSFATKTAIRGRLSRKRSVVADEVPAEGNYFSCLLSLF